MSGVVSAGTGSMARSAIWPLAGKTGTAEVLLDGNPAVHQWFVGYGPADRPRYAVAVLAANRPSGSFHQASVIFKEVMDVLATGPS